MAICYFCPTEVDDGDYCHGCREYVCEDCDEVSLMGPAPHDVEDHQKDD